MLLYQLKNGYCYNSDSLAIYSFAINFIKNYNEVLEVGSGCGIVGLLVKRDKDINLTQVDILQKNIFLNLINSKINDLKSNIINADFLQYETKMKYDFILSNPPFYNSDSKQSKNIHKNISRYEIHLPFESFIKKTNSLLKPKGSVLFCYKSDKLQNVFSVLLKYKLNVTHIRPVFNKSTDQISSIILIKASKSSNSPLKILQPLYYFQNNDYSEEFDKIIKKANTYSIKCDIDRSK